MKQVFILQNQHKQFLTKQGEWLDAPEANSLYRSEYKDEALNQQFEASSKDYTLRISLLHCSLNERGIPVIPVANFSDALGMPDAVDTEVEADVEVAVDDVLDIDDGLDLADSDTDVNVDLDYKVDPDADFDSPPTANQ